MNLAGKRILVTGSSRGIGRAIAEECARRGATVVVHGPEANDELDEAYKAITSLSPRTMKRPAELSDPHAIEGLFADIDENLGGLDALVNNAATQNGHPILDLPVEDWDRIMAVNLRAPFLCALHAARGMVSRG
jgi:NAD(P)-dependent dehydrogenase (short-subunit alcohol dehydrogenase family)